MTDEYLIERGYMEYRPTVLDDKSIVARFQKRFDDNFGKKYFINAIKWSNEYIPIQYRTEHFTPFTYEYEAQVTVSEKENPINLQFFADWELEKVEEFMEDLFNKMKLNYYESWETEERHVRPKE